MSDDRELSGLLCGYDDYMSNPKADFVLEDTTEL
jgi:hypothetical protein